MMYALGKEKSRYEVSIPYPNGYYYARLQNLTPKKGDRAGVVLFAPQASSDAGAPVIDLPSQIRLPIYSTKTFKISEIMTDLSNAQIFADGDLTLDSNGDNIPDNDFSKVGTGFKITQTEISFGLFNKPGKYTMNLQAVDEE